MRSRCGVRGQVLVWGPTGAMSKAITLYRTILKQHRFKLPPEMRALGDRYVKEEFRQHKNAKPEFLARFFDEWEKYSAHLGGSPPSAGYGKPIGEAVNQMTDEQKTMLAKLAEESRKVPS